VPPPPNTIAAMIMAMITITPGCGTPSGSTLPRLADPRPRFPRERRRAPSLLLLTRTAESAGRSEAVWLLERRRRWRCCGCEAGLSSTGMALDQIGKGKGLSAAAGLPFGANSARRPVVSVDAQLGNRGATAGMRQVHGPGAPSTPRAKKRPARNAHGPFP
jgi:hypothetical protein